MSFRMDKIDKLIYREISIVLNQIKDKYLGFLTVTRVETAKDLSVSKIWVSTLERAQTEEAINNVLKHYHRDIYNHIKARVPLKKVPHLIFKLDTSMDVLDLLNK
jgi:ribosome-binding factor A